MEFKNIDYVKIIPVMTSIKAGKVFLFSIKTVFKNLKIIKRMLIITVF